MGLPDKPEITAQELIDFRPVGPSYPPTCKTMEQFLSVSRVYGGKDAVERVLNLRRHFLELLKTPQFHMMTEQERADAVGVPKKTLAHWEAMVPDDYLRECLMSAREQHARASLKVDAALLREATVEGGDAKHKELFYRRVEGWNPAQNVELSRGKDKDMDGKANFELLKELVAGLSEEQRAELLGKPKETPVLEARSDSGTVYPESKE